MRRAWPTHTVVRAPARTRARPPAGSERGARTDMGARIQDATPYPTIVQPRVTLQVCLPLVNHVRMPATTPSRLRAYHAGTRVSAAGAGGAPLPHLLRQRVVIAPDARARHMLRRGSLPSEQRESLPDLAYVISARVEEDGGWAGVFGILGETGRVRVPLVLFRLLVLLVVFVPNAFTANEIEVTSFHRQSQGFQSSGNRAFSPTLAIQSGRFPFLCLCKAISHIQGFRRFQDLQKFSKSFYLSFF